MASMKFLLRAAFAGVFVSAAATPLVACGPDDKGVTLNEQVQKDLGLLTSEGKPADITAVSITGDGTTGQEFAYSVVDGVKTLTGSSFVDSSTKKAKSEDSKNFLINILGVNPGDDGVFNDKDLAKVTVVISEISAKITANADNNKLIVSEGTFKLQFQKDGKDVGSKYDIKVVTDKEINVETSLATIAKKLDLTADTDLTTNANINFVIGKVPGVGTTVDKIKGQPVVITVGTDHDKAIKQLADLTGLDFTCKVTDTSGPTDESNTKWKAADTITIGFSVDKVVLTKAVKVFTL